MLLAEGKFMIEFSAVRPVSLSTLNTATICTPGQTDASGTRMRIEFNGLTTARETSGPKRAQADSSGHHGAINLQAGKGRGS